MINMHDGDFAYMIADIPNGFVQDGLRIDLCKKVLDPSFKLDITGNFSKLKGRPVDTNWYDRDVVKLSTINGNTMIR